MNKLLLTLGAAMPLALAAGTASASVTFNLTAGILDIPDGSLVALVADDGDGDFGDLTNPGTFTPDDGDTLIATFAMNSNLGLAGGLSQSQGWADNAGFTGNDVALLFYHTAFSESATGPGTSVSGGIVTGITADQYGIGGQAWEVPADGATVAFNFLTDSLGEAFLGGPTGTPNSAGQTSFTTLDLGDMNGDGALDAFDVAPFELALADPSAYMVAFPGLDPDVLGDFDGSGAFDAFDVAPFEVVLAGGAAVPEPATLGVLTLIGGMATLRRRK